MLPTSKRKDRNRLVLDQLKESKAHDEGERMPKISMGGGSRRGIFAGGSQGG